METTDNKPEVRPDNAEKVEFVSNTSTLTGNAKPKIVKPAKSPVADTAETGEAAPAVAPHVPPTNLTPGSPLAGKDTFSGGMPVVLNSRAELAKEINAGPDFVINELGHTMPGQGIAAGATITPPMQQVVVTVPIPAKQS